MAIPFISEKYLLKVLGDLHLDTPEILKALTQAKSSHFGKKRDDGADYLTQHIYPIVKSIIEYCLQEKRNITEELIIGGLLHDALEDDPRFTKGKLRRNFGRNAAIIVKFLTKDSWKKYSGKSKWERKMVLTQSYLTKMEGAPEEARIIKLADRLNNLSCIHLSPNAEKRKYYLTETEELYLPFAKRHSTYFYFKLKCKLEEQLLNLG